MKRRFLFLGGLLGLGACCLPEAQAQTVVIKRVIRNRVQPAGAAADGSDHADPDKAPPPPPAVLRWNNGETVSGEAAEATDKDLTWKSPLFEDPLLLDWRVLHRIDQALPDGAPTIDPFRFTLRDGSHLYGTPSAISADTVTVHSARCGDIVLRRSEVLAARRIKGGQLIYDGPLGDANWTTVANEKSSDDEGTKIAPTLGGVPAQHTGPGGALALPFWHRAAFLKLPLPQRMDVEFRLRSKDAPAFQLALVGEGNQRLRVETWGGELVLAAGDSFQSIRRLDPAEREIALRVCWDQSAKSCEVYTPEGSKLVKFAVPEEKSEQASGGVRLQNKGRELSLDFLRVRTWDGQAVAVADPGQGRVELDNGQVVPGQVSGLTDGTLTITPADPGSTASFPLDAVDALIISNAASPVAEPHGTTLAYADGTFLRGEILGIKDSNANLKTTFADTPVTAKMAALRSLFVAAADPKIPPGQEPAQDQLVIQGATLHGQVTATAGDAALRWTPVGGERPALPSRTIPVEMIRFDDAKAGTAGASTFFYTRMGDTLPGALHGLDRTEVEFDSPLVETKKLPSGEWQAVQFNVPTGGSIQGFNSTGWHLHQKNGEQIQPPNDALTLTDGTRLTHSQVMLNGDLKFSYDTNGFSFLRLRMFCDGANPARALNYILFRSGNSISNGIESTDGQFSYRNSNSIKNGPAVVRLAVDAKGVRFYLNDALLETIPYPAAKRAGSGLIIEPAGMWGNSVADVAVSKFAGTIEPGETPFQDVSTDAKMQALTVPRFRKEDLPRHALVAMNGDLLRGEIEAVTNTQFGFRIGLETLHVPRDRVAAVIALQTPSDSAPPPDENAAALKLLERPIEQRMGYGSANFTTLLEVVKKIVPELKFKLLDKDTTEGVQYFFSPKSAGLTLDDLCEKFGLRYHLEKGVVFIEKRISASDEPMLREPYWLKAHAFSDKESASDVLAAKGVPFPVGASAYWREGTRCLEVTNTAANQETVVALLGREFGGVAPPPTHWLQLIHGGRLGLTVEKFEPGTISGTHPVYGHCSIPMSEVHSIRNTLPEASASSRVVEGWQLAYAPEPVLPESGGEESAMLGKEAPTFKLAMLEGGDFDLAEQKGHVVVLDFWATWCGPCIKSLPGLIETMAQFPADQVRLVGLNQAEAPEQVKHFLSTRGWKLAVAMDAGQNVARQYGVDGIPHTVVIGPDGKVAWVKTGYSDGGETAVAEAVKKLLSAGTGPTTASAEPVNR